MSPSSFDRPQGPTPPRDSAGDGLPTRFDARPEPMTRPARLLSRVTAKLTSSTPAEIDEQLMCKTTLPMPMPLPVLEAAPVPTEQSGAPFESRPLGKTRMELGIPAAPAEQHAERVVHTRLGFAAPAVFGGSAAMPARMLRVGAPAAPTAVAPPASATAIDSLLLEPRTQLGGFAAPRSQSSMPASPFGGSGERATENIDMRVFMGLEVPLPELGNSEDSGSRWSTSAHLEGSSDDSSQEPSREESADAESSSRFPGVRKLLLPSLAVVVLGLLVVSFTSRSSQHGPITELAPTAGPAAQPDAKPSAAGQGPVARAEPAVHAPSGHGADDASPAVATPVRPHARDRVERGGATAQSAASLYLRGQYREALAEYRLLASSYPDQTVYAEVARILKRKLFDTCVRTQPQRREQCKQL